MPSSRIFYETFRHPLYPENEKLDISGESLWGRFQNAYDVHDACRQYLRPDVKPAEALQ